MKTFRKPIIVIITSLTLLIGSSNIASAAPLQTPNHSSYLPDVAVNFYWWGNEIVFGKNETKQIAQAIASHSNESIAGICAAISGENFIVGGVCTLSIKYATAGMKDGFAKAAKDNYKSQLEMPYIGGILRWTVQEMPED